MKKKDYNKKKNKKVMHSVDLLQSIKKQLYNEDRRKMNEDKRKTN